LALARNEGCGLRCIFHGWKIDVSGKVVDVPTHSPNPEAFAAKVPVGHYQTHEGGGIIWVRLGAQEAPPFPQLPFTVMPASQVWLTITKCYGLDHRDVVPVNVLKPAETGDPGQIIDYYASAK